MSGTAYARWRSQPFPRSSDDDYLDELNKDLAYWDAMAAEAIIPTAEHGAPYDSGVLDIQAGLASCRQAIIAAGHQHGRGGALFIDRHLTYIDLVMAANAEASGTL